MEIFTAGHAGGTRINVDEEAEESLAGSCGVYACVANSSETFFKQDCEQVVKSKDRRGVCGSLLRP